MSFQSDGGPMEPILLRAEHETNSKALTTSLKLGGYSALKKALIMNPEDIREEVKKSGLRGRGGAGFPTGVKWGFVPQDLPKPKYLICNADESEPGTFKDRKLIHTDPHMLIEGIIISSYAINAHTAYIYIRGEFYEEVQILEQAIAEAYKKHYLGKNILKTGYDLDVYVHRGAGAYICGEETALMESIEGKRGQPRLKPPFPAVVGLFGCPTVINNVETLACVPHIIERGADWFASIGRPRNTGPKLFCVSGHVNRPGVYELPLSVTYREIIEKHCGGVRDGKKLKGFIPGGSSAPVLPASAIDIKADFDSVAEAGSMFGSGALIVLDETTDMVWLLENLLTFYTHESCGQCTPCREGGNWALEIVRRIRRGYGRPEDLETLERISQFASRGMTLCPLGDAFCGPITGVLTHFRGEFEQAIAKAKPLPKKKLPALPVRSGRGTFGM